MASRRETPHQTGLLHRMGDLVGTVDLEVEMDTIDVDELLGDDETTPTTTTTSRDGRPAPEGLDRSNDNDSWIDGLLDRVGEDADDSDGAGELTRVAAGDAGPDIESEPDPESGPQDTCADPDPDPDPEHATISPTDLQAVALDHLLHVADAMADEMEVAVADLRAAASRVRGYGRGQCGDDGGDDDC